MSDAAVISEEEYSRVLGVKGEEMADLTWISAPREFCESFERE